MKQRERVGQKDRREMRGGEREKEREKQEEKDKDGQIGIQTKGK